MLQCRMLLKRKKKERKKLLSINVATKLHHNASMGSIVVHKREGESVILHILIVKIEKENKKLIIITITIKQPLMLRL